MKHFQGDDIPFELKLKKGKWNDFSCVDVYFYTSEENKMKFSTDESKGYSPLEIDAELARGVIPSEASKLMCGNLIAEVRVQVDTLNACKRLDTSLEILKTTIKQEAL